MTTAHHARGKGPFLRSDKGNIFLSLSTYILPENKHFACEISRKEQILRIVRERHGDVKNQRKKKNGERKEKGLVEIASRKRRE